MNKVMSMICAICGRIYQAKIPKGGDGSVWWPRKHYRKASTKVRLRSYCPGSFKEGDLIEDKENG